MPFLDDPVTLPVKSSTNVLPSSLNPAGYFSASDYTAIRNALIDLRTAAIEARDNVSDISGLEGDVADLITQFGTLDAAIVALDARVNALELAPGGGDGDSILSVSALNYATGPAPIDPTGLVDSRAGLQAAINAAVAAKKDLEIPPGTYLLSKNPAGAYSLDVTGSNLVIRGIRGRTIFKHVAGMSASVAMLRIDDVTNTKIEGIYFHGNWGNYITKIANDSHGLTLPQATIYVDSTAEFPSTGTFNYVDDVGAAHVITYTGKTATTFTGCSGGTATMRVGVKVGVETNKLGINHLTQVDPKNHGIMIRGATNVHIEQCDFYQIYGDAIWLGSSSVDFKNGANRVQVYNCTADVCARSGIAVGQKSEELHVFRSYFTNICAGAFDTEAQGGLRAQWIRDMVAESSRFGTWWCPQLVGRSGNVCMTIVGCAGWPNANNEARKYRVHDCDIEGSCTIQSARDIKVTSNRFEINHAGVGYAPILIRMGSGDIWADDNWIYDRGSNDGSAPHEACIDVQAYTGGTANFTPTNVRVRGNTVNARNGRIGIQVKGTGGGAYSSGLADQNGDTGTATYNSPEYPHNSGGDAGEIFVCADDSGSANHVDAQTALWTVNSRVGWVVKSKTGGQLALVTSNTTTRLNFAGGWRDEDDNPATTPSFDHGGGGINPTYITYPVLEDSTKSWTPNQWASRQVTMGGLTAGIIHNWSTRLILDRTGGWHDVLEGIPRPTPVAGTYKILPYAGIVNIEKNRIDSGADQNSAGGAGIKIYASRAGARVRVHRNEIFNAAVDAIVIESVDSNRQFESLEVTDNEYVDIQSTRTLINGVKFVVGAGGGIFARKFIMRGNTPDSPDLVTSMTGLASGWWLVEDGTTQRWEGFGSPEGIVTASPGSTAVDRSGGLSSTFFVKETGTSNTGWTPLGGTAGAALPVWASQLGLVGGTYDPSCLTSASVTPAAGQVFLFKARAFSTTIAKVVAHCTVAIAGGTAAFVGIYKSDGTQTSEMTTATVDIIGSIGTTGVKTFTLTNPVTVNVGDDIYIAILITGTPGTSPQFRSNTGNLAINGNLTSSQGLRSGATGSGLTSLPSSITLSAMSVASSMAWVGIQ